MSTKHKKVCQPPRRKSISHISHRLYLPHHKKLSKIINILLGLMIIIVRYDFIYYKLKLTIECFLMVF